MSLLLPLLLLAIWVWLVVIAIDWWIRHAVVAAELTGNETDDAEVIRRLIKQGSAR